MKRITIIFIIFSAISSNLKAQTETNKLGRGFAMTTFGAINQGLTDGRNYVITNDYSNNQNYTLENNFGYNFGVGLSFQGPHYAFEIPFTYRTDRFSVPTLSNNTLKITSVEVGLCHYIKFLKEKHYFVFGGYVANILNGFGGTYTLGWNVGYGFNFTKRLNLSLRYKYNLLSLEGSNTAIEVSNIDANNINYFDLTSYYNSLQLVLRFDIINTRKLKTNKTSTNSNKYTISPDLVSTPIVNTQKTVLDYSKYSDTLLEQAYKSAKSIGEMQLIQKEIDSRKLLQAQKKEIINEYEKYNKNQLNEFINEAVAKEDFLKAEKIQSELNNRKKAAEEIQKNLEEAVKVEDYEKAAKLQENINYLER